MINWFSQIATLTAFNMRTLGQRKGSVLAAVFGIAGVVAVLIGVLSIAEGFRHTMTVSGSPDTAIILRSGADSEMMSILSREEMQVVSEAPGVARSNGVALSSPEIYVIVNLPKRSTGTDANVPLRGVHPVAFSVRPEMKIVSGRNFRPGQNEVIVGTGALEEIRGLDLGSQLRFGAERWNVVGVFSAAGGLPESEIWTDAAVLAPAYRRGSTYQAGLVKLASPGSFQPFKDALSRDPRVNLKVERETDFYAGQSQMLYRIITGLGSLVAGLMAIGAIFGALNTMYTAVASRAREIATLKALGFGSSPVVVSIIAESVLLATVGGILGGLAAWLAFDGYRAATLNMSNFSQVTFGFDVNPKLLRDGVLYAVLIGIIGGLFPAIRAARMPVARALRAN